jgi:hypothetical protein
VLPARRPVFASGTDGAVYWLSGNVIDLIECHSTPVIMVKNQYFFILVGTFFYTLGDTLGDRLLFRYLSFIAHARAFTNAIAIR